MHVVAKSHPEFRTNNEVSQGVNENTTGGWVSRDPTTGSGPILPVNDDGGNVAVSHFVGALSGT